ncbi:MAG: hypothetical protein AAFX93_03315 [Verrucomicrobiota bacterium]
MIIAEKGSTNTDTLVIVFLNQSNHPEKFREKLCRAYGFDSYHKIFVYDRSTCMTLLGIPPERKDFNEVRAEIESLVKRFAPKRLITTGSSAGSFPALLFGHLLKADVAVAIAPFTNLDPDALSDQELMVRRQMKRVQRLIDENPEAPTKYMNLRSVLDQYNGKTKYLIHVSRGFQSDYQHAINLEGLPGVRIHEHLYNDHSLDTYLADTHQLKKCHSANYRVPNRLQHKANILRYLAERRFRNLLMRLPIQSIFAR